MIKVTDNIKNYIKYKLSWKHLKTKYNANNIEVFINNIKYQYYGYNKKIVNLTPITLER